MTTPSDFWAAHPPAADRDSAGARPAVGDEERCATVGEVLDLFEAPHRLPESLREHLFECPYCWHTFQRVVAHHELIEEIAGFAAELAAREPPPLPQLEDPPGPGAPPQASAG